MVAFREIANLRLLRQPSHRQALRSRALLRILENLPESVRRALFRGTAFHCPLCEADTARFLVWRSSANEWCPVCGAMARHRFTWVYLQRRTDLFAPGRKRVLHVAPEPGLEARLRRVAGLEYLTADLVDPRAMVRLDLTAIGFPDGHFDVILCSHVLEHIPAIDRALAELHRVLAPGGWAALAVPVRKGPTIGDPGETDPAERERRFGQHDHFWYFGDDFAARLEKAGFAVDTVRPSDIADAEACRRMALPGRGPIFHCRPAG